MKKINLLPPETAEKIAAGEVIERPFSVVKELVENSLDAGASEVRIDLQSGGKRLVRVSDNGCGMSREDASLCLERHATSKIASDADLERIATLGFRGEALASIAAVSELTLKTSDGEGESGTLIERKDGGPAAVQEIAFPRGTSVEVRELFFNLPARRKFLRSDQSELGLAVRYVTGVALAFPEVKFSLFHSRREILNCPPVASVKERIFQLYGKEVLGRLMEVDFQEGEGRISGYGSRPPAGRPDRAHQHFFVNRRPVKDRILQAALSQAYRGLLEKDTFPEAFLFLSLPFGAVDVNVHPAKAEVRFRESQFVFYLLLRAVEAAAIAAGGIKGVYPAGERAADHARVGETSESGAWLRPEGSGIPRDMLFPPRAEPGSGPSRPRVLGQYLNTYIVAAGEDGILIIDQHNAHERVLFEKYKEIDAQKGWPQRVPLIPILFELSPSEALSLEKNSALLGETGFKVDNMGGRTYALNGFPDIFEAEAARDVLLTLLGEIETEELSRKKEKLLATLACKTAIKANEILPREKMDYLAEELFKTANPSLCPHGRPIVIKIDRGQIEKGLKRTS